jgi:Aminopeptidase P, N-terminal domain
MCRRWAIPFALFLISAIPAAAAAAPLQDDLKARRARLMDRLGPDTLAIFWSAPARNYSLDVNYEYRQDVRIEDSYLLTPSELERLSSTVPRTLDEIERFLKQAGTARR